MPGKGDVVPRFGTRNEFEIRIVVQPQDIDDLGHVNNATYLQYVEQVARAHADAVGMTLPRLVEIGMVPVVRRHTVTYHRPAMEGEELLVRTVITSARGARATRHNEVLRALSGELLVDADTEWVWINPETGMPRPTAPEILEAFGMNGAGNSGARSQARARPGTTSTTSDSRGTK